MDVTIIIPTKNGGDRFGEVLEAIRNQKTDYQYEIVVVDSGSSDDTVLFAKANNCIVQEIRPEEFGHGKTRNLAASLGTGEYICVLTQDAVPADSHWLDNLIAAMKAHPHAAGAFGRHLPYADCNMPDQQLLENLFNNFLTSQEENAGNPAWRIFKLDGDNKAKFEEDLDFQQFTAFFSDNNSCLRRSVWEKIPYDDVNYAEDQVWAKTILRAGYEKLYVDDARVYHSHNYPLSEYGKRYFDDFKAVYRTYGAVYCNDRKEYWHKVLGDTKYQFGYIRRRSDLSLADKLSWIPYCYKRNKLRYQAAMDAVAYFSLDKEKQLQMDKEYSQQYTQIRE